MGNSTEPHNDCIKSIANEGDNIAILAISVGIVASTSAASGSVDLWDVLVAIILIQVLNIFSNRKIHKKKIYCAYCSMRAFAYSMILVGVSNELFGISVKQYEKFIVFSLWLILTLCFRNKLI